MNFEPHKCDFLFSIFLGHIYTYFPPMYFNTKEYIYNTKSYMYNFMCKTFMHFQSESVYYSLPFSMLMI